MYRNMSVKNISDKKERQIYVDLAICGRKPKLP